MSPSVPPRRRSVVVAILLLTLVVTACTGADGDFETIGNELSTDGANGAPTPDQGSGERTDGDDAAEEPDDDTGAQATLVQVADFGREIIFTAAMTVAVADVTEAGDEATQIIDGLGGFLFGQKTDGSPNAVSVLTFKIAPEGFDEALDRIGSVGEVRSQKVSAEDVTERVVDLQSQITTAAASVERLRALLGEARDIKTIIDLEAELLSRETLLEGLRGQLRTIEDHVAMATILVTLTEAASDPKIAVDVTGYEGHDSGSLCPGAEDLVFDSGSDATICFSILNTGDTNLASFELRDPGLDLEIGDLVAVVGDPGDVLEPGESLVLAAEVEVERTLRTQTSVSAQPVDENGEEISGRMATATIPSRVESIEEDGIPSFTEGLQASWQWLVSLGEYVLVAAGAVIPFIWIPIALFFALRWWGRGPETAPPDPDHT